MDKQRRARVLKIVRRIWIVAAASTWLACVAVDGEVSETGTCPAGETCVSTEGLRFSGDFPSDLVYSDFATPQIHPTAVGGTQHISVGRALGDFVVESDPASIFGIESQGEDSFVVRAVSPGSATVSVRDSAGSLYDRTTLRAEAIDSITLRPATYDMPPELDWSYYRGGGDLTIVFALKSAAGERLIDESAMPLASATVDAVSHDSAQITLPTTGTTLAVSIALGSGETRTVTAPLVATIDRWTRFSVEETDLVRAPSVRLGSRTTLCFLARSGEHAVANVPITVETDALLSIEGVPEQDVYPCVTVNGVAEGYGELVVRGGGAELRQSVLVESL